MVKRLKLRSSRSALLTAALLGAVTAALVAHAGTHPIAPLIPDHTAMAPHEMHATILLGATLIALGLLGIHRSPPA